MNIIFIILVNLQANDCSKENLTVIMEKLNMSDAGIYKPKTLFKIRIECLV